VEIARKSRKGRKTLTLSCPADGDHKGILIITRAVSKQKSCLCQYKQL